MALKKSVLNKLNVILPMGDGALRYQNRLCVPDVDGLRNTVLEEIHGFRYFIHSGPPKCIVILERDIGGMA